MIESHLLIFGGPYHVSSMRMKVGGREKIKFQFFLPLDIISNSDNLYQSEIISDWASLKSATYFSRECHKYHGDYEAITIDKNDKKLY